MPPQIPSSKTTLSIPLMTADFDPRDDRFLVVGGGGGEGRTGVGNKIILLDTSSKQELVPLQEINLSRDEDSVTSLGVAHSSPNHLITFGGVNSSQEEQDKGNNEHLRSFRFGYPLVPETTSRDLITVEGSSATLSKASLFRQGPGKPGVPCEAYQKLLRLSPWHPHAVEQPRRIGVISTGMEDLGEIVTFDASPQGPKLTDVINRLNIGQDKEAEDIDIIELEDGGFRVAYTDGNALFTFDTSNTSDGLSALPLPEPKAVYTVPKESGRIKIRGIKFLSPTTFVILRNLPDRSGCELILHSDGVVTRGKKLVKDMKMGLGLDVSTLPASETGERQFVIAVSGSNHAIELFTVDYRGGSGKKSYSRFKRYTTLQNVHTFTITKIILSTFFAPTIPPELEMADMPTAPSTKPTYATDTTKPPFVKLASVSVGNTVVVHHLPLLPYPSKSDPKRYVLAAPTTSSRDVFLTSLWSFSALLVVILSAVFLQAVSEIRGSAPPTLGAKEWLHPKLHDIIARPYFGLSGEPPVVTSPIVTHTVTVEENYPAVEMDLPTATEGTPLGFMETADIGEIKTEARTVEAELPGTDEAEPQAIVDVSKSRPSGVISAATGEGEVVEPVVTSGDEPVKEAVGPQGSAREEHYLDEWFLD